MELCESARLIFVQMYLRASDDQRRHWFRLNESWEWFLVQFGPIITRQARRARWAEPEAREQEIWPFLIPRLLRLHFDPRRGPLAVLVELVVREALADALRSTRATRPQSYELADLLDMPDQDDPGLARLEKEELRYVLLGAINILRAAGAETHALILEQYWFAGLTSTAIASELGLSPEQVRFQHFKARQKLRAILLRDRCRDSLPDWVETAHARENFEKTGKKSQRSRDDVRN